MAQKVNTHEKKQIQNQGEYVKFFSEKKSFDVTVLDLFCGCGGMSLGFKRAGYNVLAGVDNDEVALKTYRHNLDTLGLNADLSSSKYIDKIKGAIKRKKIDIIIGGPPCQGFSLTGTRLLNDPRNNLFKSFFNAIDEFKPKIVLLENVRGMKSLYKGVIKKEIISEFESRGYNTANSVLNAADYGVPQNRERFFIIASKLKKKISIPEPLIDAKFKINCKAAISDLHDIGNLMGEEKIDYKNNSQNFYQKLMRKKSNRLLNHVGTNHKQFVIDTIKQVPDGGNYKDLPEGVGTSRTFNEAWTRYSSKKPSKTIDTGHRNHFHYKYNRVLTARENARLQSFPDDFELLGTKTSQNKQVGNAVPVFLSQAIATHIKGYFKQ